MTRYQAFQNRMSAKNIVPQRNIGTTRNLLRRRFLPGSFGTPASALGTRGNRTTANTTQINTPGPYAPPTDTTQIKLVNGIGRWQFAVNFPRGVNVTITPQGDPPSAGTTVNIESVQPQGVTIKSTDSSDARIVHLAATGPT